MRLTINLPELFPFVFNVPVRITDINYGNHTGNHAMVSIIHESRMQWLMFNHFTELNIDGVGLIMADLAIQFKNESFYGDVISVQLGVGDITLTGFELFYQLTATRGDKQILIAKAKTGMVCFDYTNKRIVAIPEVLKKLIGG